MSSEYGRNLIKKHKKLKEEAQQILNDTEGLESTAKLRTIRRRAKNTIGRADAVIRNWSKYED